MKGKSCQFGTLNIVKLARQFQLALTESINTNNCDSSNYKALKSPTKNYSTFKNITAIKLFVSIIKTSPYKAP